MINYEFLKNKKVCLLISGGVDSGVSLYELASHGIHPDCFYINIGPDENEKWNCNSEEDVEMCLSLTKRFGCKFEIIDCHEDYWRNVVKYTMDKVKSGFTPNPDVMCNRLIKFGSFDRKKGHEYDFIATGHYAQSELDSDGRRWLLTSPDPVKDQTDFLSQIESSVVQKIIFPIGHLMKYEVREIAEKNNLINSKRKDSQGICFLGKINYNDYIRKFLGEKTGDVIDIDTGRKLGTHKGHWFHTIGQRKGLGFGGGPWFVFGKDTNDNVIYVCHQKRTESDLFCKTFKIGQFNFLNNDVELPSDITFKIRHSDEFYHGRISKTLDGNLMVNSNSPVWGVSPGQFCTVYDSDFRKCYGSGEIMIKLKIY